VEHPPAAGPAVEVAGFELDPILEGPPSNERSASLEAEGDRA
jgi:hypothetical protein